ncbi:SH3 domain-containing protein [Salmonella enterica]|uniref:SH3 domain-containing protein n=1 Tax=Salmonella enterica TaxID=28901 RepID=UPI0009ABC992|nr:SH3 domain-containing protein [Salmonella enterica]
MMKEKKTSLNNNENGTGLPFKPSIVSENKLQNTVFSAIGSASPAHKLVQGSSVAAFLKNHESLFASTAVSSAFAAQKLAQDSGAAAFLKSHESLLASTTVSSAFTVQKLAQDSGAAAFLKSHESLLAGTAVSSAFAAQKLVQDFGAAAFLKSHESLFASTAVSSAFVAHKLKLVQDSGITALFKKQGGIFNENYFATSVAKHLEKLNATEIKTLQEAAILFSRSPQGAAIIATNVHAVEVKEPDALTKLKNHIEKSPITSSFRKLPLLVQLIIIYLVTTMYSVIVDKNKELAMDLIEQAQQYVSKSISPKTHLKKLTKQLPREVDISTLKHIRIITGENVRLRNTPSMQGDVLVKLEKYTPVIVIDKSDRKWLYVQLSFGEQKIYGWVNRSYTKAINH